MSRSGTIRGASCSQHIVRLESYESVTSLNVERSENPLIHGESDGGISQSGPTDIRLFYSCSNCVFEGNVVLKKLNKVSGKRRSTAAVGKESH